MRKLLSILALLLLAWGVYQLQASISDILTGHPQQSENLAVSGMLTPNQAAELLQRHPNGSLAILDVRTPAEFEAGHARNAINIPVQELARRLVPALDYAATVAAKTCLIHGSFGYPHPLEE